MKRNQPSFAQRIRLRPIVLTAIVPLILIACSLYFLNIPEPVDRVVEADAVLNGVVQQENEAPYEESKNEMFTHQKEPEKPLQVNEDKETTTPAVKFQKPATVSTHYEGKGITAIGDSVMLDAAPLLEKKLPGIVVDGKVGRQMRQAADVVERLKAQGRLGDRIIIELGTNGSFNKKLLRNLLHSLGEDKQIILVNTRVPRKWQDTVNRDISEVSNEFGNATVVDWYAASEGRMRRPVKGMPCAGLFLY
ncbi:hypothetical protein MUG84_18680 [Paenibacillus sp. KQZ6P-2]|uniref:Uncharacterized protein n=1 Tax=Paenibacillus mangrovi TaxID=2931978 RepID=A0A9X2B3S9_9BACL|nr:hypothetical protein [Paenibacillus mangrovi]MCJ8013756.1 hypothetical protein [Paenibacillus mangrovi]